MDRWQGRVALVTGASAGIGASITRILAVNGLTVVGLARRDQHIKEIANQLTDAKGKVYAVKADVTKEEDIKSAFQWIKTNLGGVDILINNAGISIKTLIKDGEMDKWRTMYELNVLAFGSFIRETLSSLKERGLDDGHIINVNSISGHRLTSRFGHMIYSSTKFASKILTEGLRLELAEAKSKIKVTNLSPGLTRTDILQSGGWNEYFLEQNLPMMHPDSIANTVLYILSTPSDVQIAELMVRPVGEGQ